MKKYKLTLIVILLFSFGLNLCFSVSAETIDSEYYAELLQEKKEYIEARGYRPTGADVFSVYHPLISPSLRVLLYTNIGPTLTIERARSEGGDLVSYDCTWFIFDIGDDLADHLHCKEIVEATKLCKKGSYGAMQARSALRECIKYFDISKEELLQAYKTMEEDPDVIRPLLSCLSDKEYESAKGSDGTFGGKPFDFMIEALYIEDDALAHRLLCDVYSVYVKEFGSVITPYEVFHTWQGEERYEIDTEELIICDLTGEEFAEFLTYAKNVSIPYMEGADCEAAYKKVAQLESAREKQLSAKAGREAVFVGELGSMLTAERLFGTAEEAPTVTVVELAVCDLTGEDMGNFLSYLRENIESYESGADPADGRTPLEKLEYLEAQREAQLKAADTGDGMEKAFLAVGIGIGALVLLAIVRKKRKI